MSIWLWLQLGAAIVLVVTFGAALSQNADIVAEKSQLGHSWVGTFLLAGVTSLPELATGMSAVAVFDAPDLATGGIFGSCLFNLCILALLDFFCGPDPLFQRAQISHGLAAGLGCVLLGIAAAGIILGHQQQSLNMGWLSETGILLLLIYFVSARLIAKFELQRREEVLEQEAEAFQYQHIPIQRAYVRFGLCALVIVGAGAWLAYLGEAIAEQTGLGDSFIGALLLAATTSLPEVVTSLEAIRLNAVDLAVSNIFGSNLLNLGILGSFDWIYFKGNLFAAVSEVHLMTAIIAMIMTSVAIVGLIYRAAVRRSQRYVTWDGVTLIGLYIFGMYMIYQN